MNRIYEYAIEKNGKEIQLNIIKEELAELLVSINHFERGRCDIEDVVSEIADVKICLKELQLIYGISDTDIEREVVFKTSRLADRMYQGEEQ